MITIQTIPDPMSDKDRVDRQVPFTGGTVRQYVPYEYGIGWRVITSRHPEPLEEPEWSSVEVQEGDRLAVVPVTGMEAFVVPLVIAMAQGIAMSMAAYALSYGISALMGKGVKPSYSDGNNSDSPTYGWDGIQTTSDVGIPIPIIYGKCVVGGNVLNASIENRDNENYLNVLLGLCEGPVQSIGGITSDTDKANVADIGDKIKIEGQPITNFEGVEVYTRMGNDSQSVIPHFEKLHELKEYSVLLEQNSRQIFTTQGGDVQEIGVNLKMPSCIKSGTKGFESQTIVIDIYYRKHDEDNGAETGWNYIPYFSGPNTAHSMSWEEETSNEVRKSFWIYNLPGPDQYDISIVKRSENSTNKRSVDLYVTGVDEIRYVGVTYPGIALLGLRVLATNQLSGTFSNVTVEVEGRKVEVFTEGSMTPVVQYSNNPIWCMRDLMLNKRYGLGNFYSAANLRHETFQEMADYCDEGVQIEAGDDATEPRFTCDVVLDSDQGAMDWLVQMAEGCCATVLYSSSTVMPIIEKPENVSYIFTMGNIIKGSFSQTFLSNKKNPNVLEMQFLNADSSYDRESVEVEDGAALANGSQIRRKSLFYTGVKRDTLARRLGIRILNSSRAMSKMIQFETGIGACPVQVMNVIGFQHDVPKWGSGGGRIHSATDNTVKLGSDITLEAGKSYQIKVQRGADDRVVTRNINSGLSPAGFYPAGTSIWVGSSWGSDLPSSYDVYAIGEVGYVVKPFRVIEMVRKDDSRISIKAIEYNGGTPGDQASIDAGAYSDKNLVTSVKNYSKLPDPRTPPPKVSNLKGETGFDYYVLARLTWSNPGYVEGSGLYEQALVQYSTNNSKWVDLGKTRSEMWELRDKIEVGKSYWFRIISLNKWGGKSQPTSSVKILVKPPLPANVTGLELKGQGNNTVFKGRDAVFQWKPVGSQTAIQRAGVEAYGAGTGSVDPYIRGYRVEVWNEAQNKCVKVEVVTDPRYTLSFDKNVQYFGTPTRAIHLRVYAVDIYNGKSPAPAKITVRNPQAVAVNGESIRHLDGSGDTNYWEMRCDKSTEPDIAGYLFGISMNGVIGEAIYGDFHTNSINQGRYIETPPMGFSKAIAAYDVFGKDSLTWIMAN